MDRFPRRPRFRHASTARPLVIGALAVLALTILAAGGLAATDGTERSNRARAQRMSDQQEPEDRPDRRHRTTRATPDRRVRGADRTDQRADADLHAGCARREHLQRQHQGRERLRDRRAVQPVQHPGGRATGDDGTATLVFRRDANFPASDQQQQLTLFIRATKPGEDPLAGVSTRRLVAVPFSS